MRHAEGEQSVCGVTNRSARRFFNVTDPSAIRSLLVHRRITPSSVTRDLRAKGMTWGPRLSADAGPRFLNATNERAADESRHVHA